MPTILVIDDNRCGRDRARDVLFSLHEIDTRACGRSGRRAGDARAAQVDLVVQDMNFETDTTSGEEGEALFREIRARASGSAGDSADRVDASGIGGGTGEGRRCGLPRQAVGRPQTDGDGQQSAGVVADAPAARAPHAQRTAASRSASPAITICAASCMPMPRPRRAALACQVARSDLPVLITGAERRRQGKIRRDRACQFAGARSDRSSR